MPEEMTPNMPSQPVVGDMPVQAPVVPEAPVVNPVSVPQNPDESDATTYPLGSQSVQPVPDVQTEVEDHRSILDRIMGLFSKGKKVEQPPQAQAPQMPSAPSNPPVQQ